MLSSFSPCPQSHELIIIPMVQQNTHLDRSTLSLCVSLIENGVNPEALAVSSRLLGDPVSTLLIGVYTDGDT